MDARGDPDGEVPADRPTADRPTADRSAPDRSAPDRHAAVLTLDGLQAMIDSLRADGRTVIGPAVRDGAVTHAEIRSVRDLPAGVGDEQAPGRYRLRPRSDGAVFGYTVAAESFKRLFFPPVEVIRSDPEPDGEPDGEPARYALLGARSCDLAALRVHDEVLLRRGAVDVRYARRRHDVLVVAVGCTEPGATCFCADLGTGPAPGGGYDVRLVELLDGGHRFVATAGTPAGAALLDRLPGRPATADDLAQAEGALDAAAARVPHRLDVEGLRDDLYAAAEHPHWQRVAGRCLACGACTLVCPTCFCTSVEDSTDLAGAVRTRRRAWDSCFTTDFSYLHGGSVRETTAARYRQWATHKLAAWTDQFGAPGCVGCGRCTTWCPAGIDLLAEVAAVRSEV